MVDAIFQLKCCCNNLPWGKKGSESLAARLCAKTPGTDFKIEDGKSYSEMWMGTYPEPPSYILSTGEELQTAIERQPELLLGNSVARKFGGSSSSMGENHKRNGDKTLPFLAKILSIRKALPLQLHPDKELAADLHRAHPSSFTDPNHKPEIAIALSRFEAFCGFREYKDIQAKMQLEPLKRFMPPSSRQSAQSFDKSTLKHVVRAMLMAPEKVIVDTVQQLKSLPRESFGRDFYIPDLLPRLWDQYDKADPGLLVATITMNYMVLSPGQSLYIPADGIHAYLSGDIIECMARSNNMLSVGFCPTVDRNNVDLFVTALTFEPHTSKSALLPAQIYSRCKNGKTKLYAPPLPEFSVLKIELDADETEYLDALDGPAIVLSCKGDVVVSARSKSLELIEGCIGYVLPGNEMEVKASTAADIYVFFAE